jgi:hypothetical protein
LKVLAGIATVLVVYTLCVVLWGTAVFDRTMDVLTWVFRVLKKLLNGFEGVMR